MKKATGKFGFRSESSSDKDVGDGDDDGKELSMEVEKNEQQIVNDLAVALARDS